MKITNKLWLMTVVMFGFGFALVPLYDVFCDITGLNGKTDGQVEFSKAPVVDKSRLVTVQFISTLNEEMPWEFRPMVRSVKVHPGEPTVIEYYARNKTQHAMIGQAVPSVSPGLAAPYLQKTECFCFTEQKLEANEEKLMPVRFIISNDLPKNINELTLSYTFFLKSSTDEVTATSPHAMNHNREI